MRPTSNPIAPRKFRVSDFFPAPTVSYDGLFSHLDEADTIEEGSLVYCQNYHFFGLANKNQNVSAIITTRALAAELVPPSKAVIVAEDPRFSFFTLYSSFHAKGLSLPQMEVGIGQGGRIHPSAVVSSKSLIGDRVEIGANTVIEDFVHIMDDVSIGPNVVIGAEGLITLHCDDGRLLPIKHSGGVQIGRATQILAGAVVAKSLFHSFTRIGNNCQIGILANIGHGASIGDGSVVSGNTVIAGRTKLGCNVWVGGSSSIAQGLIVGDNAQIKMGSVVVGDVLPGQVVSGNFAVSHKANMKNFFKIKSHEKF